MTPNVWCRKELGHVLLHEPGRRPADLTREQAEVEAESVAHVVAAAHGMDTSGYTIPYVAGWSAGNLELLARSAERVIATAHQILAVTPPPATFGLADISRTTERGTDRNRDRTTDRNADRGTVRNLDTDRSADRATDSLADTSADRSAGSSAGTTASHQTSAREPRTITRPRDDVPLRTSADQQRQGRLW